MKVISRKSSAYVLRNYFPDSSSKSPTRTLRASATTLLVNACLRARVDACDAPRDHLRITNDESISSSVRMENSHRASIVSTR